MVNTAVGKRGVGDDGEPDRGKDEVYFFLGPAIDAEEKGSSFKVLCTARIVIDVMRPGGVILINVFFFLLIGGNRRRS